MPCYWSFFVWQKSLQKWNLWKEGDSEIKCQDCWYLNRKFGNFCSVQRFVYGPEVGEFVFGVVGFEIEPVLVTFGFNAIEWIFSHFSSKPAKKGFQCLQPIRYLISLSNLMMCLKVENTPESYIGLCPSAQVQIGPVVWETHSAFSGQGLDMQ